MITKGIIFDLDFCIFDTRSLGERVLDPVVAPLYASNLSNQLKDTIAKTLWSTSLEDTITLFNLDASLASAMRKAHQTLVVPNDVRTYGDEHALLDLPTYRILVTSGYRAWQEAKIAKLNITPLFDEIIIDVIDDPTTRKGKRNIFSDLLTTHAWQPQEVFVVGDNPHSELAAGRALGIPTIQTLRSTIERDPLADYHITSLTEITTLLKSA